MNVDPVRRRLGAGLRERRRALGMTQAECARLLGLGRLSLLRIERGYRRVKLPAKSQKFPVLREFALAGAGGKRSVTAKGSEVAGLRGTKMTWQQLDRRMRFFAPRLLAESRYSR